MDYYTVFGPVHFQYKGCFIEIPAFNANSVDPDQTPRSAASDPGQYCLPVSLLRDARLKWVKDKFRVVWFVHIHIPNIAIEVNILL